MAARCVDAQRSKCSWIGRKFCGAPTRPFWWLLVSLLWLVSWSFVKLKAARSTPPDSTTPDADDGSLAGRTVGVCGFVAIMWMTEAVPMPATALMPAVLLPILGVLSADVAAEAYISDTIMLFLGSFFLSVAMEHVRLHARIALRLLLAVGARPRLLLGGFMISTAFLSMWMSNTATASMMIPLAMSTLLRLGSSNRKRSTSGSGRVVGARDPLIDSASGNNVVELDSSAESDNNSGDSTRRSIDLDDQGKASPNEYHRASISESQMGSDIENDIEKDDDGAATNHDFSQFSPELLRFCKGVLLAIAYSASVGGTSTLIGTGPNLVLQQQLRTNFRGYELTFGQWFAFACPLSLLFLTVVWVGFCLIYVPRPADVQIDVGVFRDEYAALGPMSFGEKVVLGDLIVMATLWFSRTGFSDDLPGWGALFGDPRDNIPRDGTIALLCAVVLFIIPVRASFSEPRRVMEWSYTKDLPWGIILVLGGGFCLARATLDSGLALWVGDQLSFFDDLSRYAFVSLLCAIIIFTTEMTSNVATANIILPVLAAIARSLGENPLLFMIPATISCSYAFALPAATPPNALAFTPGILRVPDMAKPGICLNLLGIIILPVWMFTVGTSVFGISVGTAPEWSKMETP